MALLIYTSKLNTRKASVFEHLFKNILGVDYKITGDLKLFELHQGAKISYLENAMANLSFIAHPFIDETTIKQQALDFADYDGFKVPFVVKNSVFSFDVFAATFYFLSRYEEYVMKERDQHQRYKGKNSLAYKNGFITRPLIDEWAFAIADKIKENYPDFEIKTRKFQFTPTLDIDSAYYYKTADFPKNYLKRAKLLLKFDIKSLRKDPFDVYEMVKYWDLKYRIKTIYFFLLGTKHMNDVAVRSNNFLFKQLISATALHHQIGIHPSYFSHLNAKEVEVEKQKLADLSASKISSSRQHYLLLNLPKTYRDLISAGLTDDYTLAFADVAGFRALTCTPFFWYDLENEKITCLKLHPTTVMDQTLKKYMGLSIKQADEKIAELMQNVKKVNGTFISLWHNESINDFGTWQGWQKIYLRMLEMGAGFH